jgi:hypothetical protein
LDTAKPWPDAVLKSATLAGDRLLWVSEGEGASELWTAVLQPGGGLREPRKLLRREYPEVLLTAVLSPDARFAILQSQSGLTLDPENRCTIELLSMESAALRTLTPHGSRYLVPAWCANDAFLLGESETDAVTVYRQTLSGKRTKIVHHQAPYARLLLQRLEPQGWMLVDRNQPQNLHCHATPRADALSEWTELSAPGQRARLMGWYGQQMVLVVRDSRESSRVVLENPPLKSPLGGRIVASTGAIENAFLQGSTLCYLTLDSWGHSLRKLDLRSGRDTKLPLPFSPAQGAAFWPSGQGRALLPLQGPFQPPSLYLATVISDQVQLQPVIAPGLPHLRREDFQVETLDGAIRIGPAHSDPQRPVLMESYGAFAERLPPTYDPLRLEWLRLGGQIVLVQLQGQPRQHDQVIDQLLARARAYPRVVYRGQSFGATLGLMAMQREPGRFAAVLADAPLTDLVHFAERRPGELWLAEIGDAREQQERARLLRLSPFHALKDMPYPPTIVTIARGDPITDWRHATAYVERAQALGHPAVLKVQQSGAHDRLVPSASEQATLANLLWRYLLTSGSQGTAESNRKGSP